MINILHWTEGQGTGHIKRINALLRCASTTLASGKVNYWVKAEDPKFHHLLPKHVQQWDGTQPHFFDLIVLDLEDPLENTELAQHSNTFIQLCRIGTPLELPQALTNATVQLAFEKGAFNTQHNMPYFGSLVDADANKVMPPKHAREKLEQLCGHKLNGRLALTHANSASADAALAFLRNGIAKLTSYDHLFVVCGHSRVTAQLNEEFNNSHIIVANINPIYAYYNAFDELYVPMGYNTYHEVNLFYHGKVNFTPMYPPDQTQRAIEMPTVDKIGNSQIFQFIVNTAMS